MVYTCAQFDIFHPKKKKNYSPFCLEEKLLSYQEPLSFCSNTVSSNFQ